MKSGIIRFYTTPKYSIDLSPELLGLITDTLDAELLNKYTFKKKNKEEFEIWLDIEVETNDIKAREIFKKQKENIFSVEIKLPYNKVVKDKETIIPAFIEHLIQAVSQVLKPYINAGDEVYSKITQMLLTETQNNDKYIYKPDPDAIDMDALVEEALKHFPNLKTSKD